MKIFHLSDLHIGLRLYNRDLREDQEYIFDKIIEYAVLEKPDVIVIAGDIFDKAMPSAEAVRVFDCFITKLSRAAKETAIMMISGNHDSGPRIDCYRNILSASNIYVVGIPPVNEDEYIEKVTVNDEYGPVNFYLLPFVKPSMVRNIVKSEEGSVSYDEALRTLIARESIDKNQRNVIVSHQFYLPSKTDASQVARMDSEIVTAGNIDVVGSDVLEEFDYACLGHIHKPMTAGDEKLRYCGTPLCVSVSEAGQEKSIIEVNLNEPGTRAVTRCLPLKPLRNVRILKGELEDVLKSPSDDYVSVVLTDKEDFNTFDMKERLHDAFPNILEIRIENIRKYEERRGQLPSPGKMSPYDMCMAFLGKDGMDEEDRKLIMDVINSVKGAL